MTQAPIFKKLLRAYQQVCWSWDQEIKSTWACAFRPFFSRSCFGASSSFAILNLPYFWLPLWYTNTQVYHNYRWYSTNNGIASIMVCVNAFVVGVVTTAIRPLESHALLAFMLVWKPVSSVKTLLSVIYFTVWGFTESL